MPELQIALPNAGLPHAGIPRRRVLACGLLLSLSPRLALAGPRRDLAFTVFRNGTKIGEHHVNFAGDGDALTATTDAVMTVRLGPVPVFRYHHHAVETRAADAFRSLETSTSSNGKREHVTAERTGGGVRIDCPSGKTTLAADANPLNHWDQTIFAGPLFNPQTGKLMKVRVTKAGPRQWQIRGEAQIDDFYDDSGAWRALKGKLDDGSTVEYRRL